MAIVSPEAFFAGNSRKIDANQQEALSYGQEKKPGTLAKIATGVAKGELATIQGLSNIGAGVLNTAYKPVDKALGTNIATAEPIFSPDTMKKIEPKGMAENIGYTAEKVGEFFLPAGLVTKTKVAIEATHLPSALKFFAKTGTQALSDTGVAMIQGQSNEDIKKVGLVSGAAELGSGSFGALAKTKLGSQAIKYMTEKIPARLVNSIIRPNDKAFDFGKNPGLGVVNEGITANTRGGLLAKIGLKKQSIGKQIDELLTSPENSGKIIDSQESILLPIKQAKQDAIESGDKALYERLNDVEQGLTKQFDESFNITGGKNLKLTPKELQQLKIKVGRDTRWTGQAFDNDVNKVRVQIYRNLDSLLDSNVKGIEKLNSRYANLFTAEKNLERTDKKVQRLVMAGLRTTGVGTAIGTTAALSGDGSGEAFVKGLAAGTAVKVAGSTPVLTKTAKILNKLQPKEREELFSLIPTLKNLYLGVTAKSQEEGE